ncbi:MAG: ATP-binding cassette domain-containing protein [Aerococcus sp.]|nr:ATP-binding cassette domain-containing protein [Aerococcus sp.]
MITLKHIHKTYATGGETLTALDDISLTFPDAGFVSILGQSGSGKTTLLNVIGGLDQYTSGDLIVNGTSTKDFTQTNWDSYRNETIGFIFQSYNLIMHLSVLDNVTMALSLAGISSNEAQERAKKALEQVGLAEHLHKQPSQLSGGQMQRVAIARAIVTNPQILLADEPTGALDSQTSREIMQILSEISQDRLVIIVTHNEQLAEEYSQRIIQLQDGEIIADSNPHPESETTEAGYQPTKTAMSFWMALKSSFKNLSTKKARTILIAIAGSIGFIAIGLVLALSTGLGDYISEMQETTLATLPITIDQNQVDMSFQSPMSMNENPTNSGKVTPKERPGEQTHANDFTTSPMPNTANFLDYLKDKLKEKDAIAQFKTGYSLKALAKNADGEVIAAVPNHENVTNTAGFLSTDSLFSVLPSEQAQVMKQYEVVAHTGDTFTYPTKANQAVLILNHDYSISQDTLTVLGFSKDEEVPYQKLLNHSFRILNNDQAFQEANGQIVGRAVNEATYETGQPLTITAILRPKEESTGMGSLLSTQIAYTEALQQEISNQEQHSTIVQKQKAAGTSDNVLMPGEQKINDQTYNQLLQQLGGSETPIEIAIYPATFKERETISDWINQYNQKIADHYGQDSDEIEQKQIHFLDMSKLLTESMSTLIAALTVILTGFSSIALVVSSIMIGIIMYVSVVERTKEIGIMRAIGARSKDISRIFNAEAFILGLAAGVIGVGVASGLTIPINHFFAQQFGVGTFHMALKGEYAVILVLLSLILTLLAGAIPARIASHRVPVEALRDE